jgi:hypothetical protein
MRKVRTLSGDTIAPKRDSVVAWIKTFCIEVLEEWKGWVTGSLPMAVLAVIALIYPQIAPLPLWVWLLLIFAGGFVCAVFRVYKKAKIETGNLRAQLEAIGQDRPLAYHAPIFNFDDLAFKKNDLRLKSWGIYLENLGEKMLRYSVKGIWLENHKGRRFLHSPVPDTGGFISARTKMTYSLISSEDHGMLLGHGLGITWTIGFEIDYDNVPPINRRTTEQRISFTVVSLNPLQVGHSILFREER